MSTDYDLVCDKCKVWTHCMVTSGGGVVLGHSQFDVPGREHISDFIDDHIGHGLRLMLSDTLDPFSCTPQDYDEVEHPPHNEMEYADRLERMLEQGKETLERYRKP